MKRVLVVATAPVDQQALRSRVTRSDDEAGWFEKDAAAEVSERFGIPVTRLVVS